MRLPDIPAIWCHPNMIPIFLHSCQLKWSELSAPQPTNLSHPRLCWLETWSSHTLITRTTRSRTSCHSTITYSPSPLILDLCFVYKGDPLLKNHRQDPSFHFLCQKSRRVCLSHYNSLPCHLQPAHLQLSVSFTFLCTTRHRE